MRLGLPYETTTFYLCLFTQHNKEMKGQCVFLGSLENGLIFILNLLSILPDRHDIRGGLMDLHRLPAIGCIHRIAAR